MKKDFYKMFSLLIVAFIIVPIGESNAQSSIGKTEKWLNVGSFHNWYSSIGQEREEDNASGKEQLWGWQWPAYYPKQDMQAAKGLWIGTRNYTDPQASNTTFDYKVVHCGPRPQTGGSSEFFAIEFKQYAKFQPTEVRVDGELTNYPGQQITIDELDPNMPYDQMIYNVVNTQLGMTMKRKIFQFSNPYYDNFHVTEYTFINTGNIDDDDEIERTDGDLEDVYFYFQRRHGFIKETRILFGDPTSWGANTLNNEVGPYPAGLNAELRYSYAWHGYYDKFGDYNSVGGPIWRPDEGYGARINAADTVGRLGAAQFSGMLTLFAQNGTDQTIDDPNQPSTTGYESSDGALQYAADTFNGQQMQDRYAMMVKGHPEESHADWITGGDYVGSLVVGGDKSVNGAGYSYVNGYGPYQVAYGDSVKITIVEGSSGLSRDEAIKIGKLFKAATISTAEKNIAVLGGQDSLHVTFERAMDAYKNDWDIPFAPYPPRSFEVNSRGGRIDLSWELHPDGPEVKGFEIYRNTLEAVDGYASNEYYSKFEKIADLSSDVLEYQDTTQRQDIAYYYYIVSVGEDQPANPALNIPAHTLKSNRSYTQSYTSAFKRSRGEDNITDKVRVYPNPYIISASDNWMFGSSSVERNKISFDNLSGVATILIFTELGELIKTIEHNDGSGSDDWDLRTSSNQLVVSGIYIAVITDGKTGDREIVKFSIIR
ncbi:MAG: T9SS type A sorting domain-containing protein [Melioribacteraceae bacterium]|nr:T9SS type A sorting domain-containing protein [Melioribacteraceae bacterium]